MPTALTVAWVAVATSGVFMVSSIAPPVLALVLDYVRDADTLVVTRLDHHPVHGCPVERQRAVWWHLDLANDLAGI